MLAYRLVGLPVSVCLYKIKMFRYPMEDSLAGRENISAEKNNDR